jgi:Cys-tRNA(Pro)/Cys-tRNA(Cys) deacylase
MTPAINTVKKSKVKYTIHKYAHDPAADSYGIEAAEKLGIDEKKVFKTLVVNYEDTKLAVGIVPVCSKLNLKLIAKALTTKKVKMANPLDVERSTGYILGGVSPLGQKNKLPTFVDISALDHPTIFVSAGRRGLEIELDPKELISLTNGKYMKISSIE